MANYFVIDNTFRPYSFDELMKPYQMYAQEYDKQEAAMAKLESDAAVLASALSEKHDPIAYQTYQNYMNSVKAAAEDIAMHGLSPRARSAATALSADYNSNIVPIQAAYNRRKELQDEQRKAMLADDSRMFQRDFNTVSDASSIDRFIEDPNYSYGATVSGKSITERSATMASHLAKELTDYGPGKPLDKYTNTFLQQHGFTRDQVLKAIQNPDSPESSPVLTAILKSAVDSSGVESWNDESALSRAYDYAGMGLWSAIGQNTVSTFENYGNRLAAQEAKEKRVKAYNPNPTSTVSGIPINPRNLISAKERNEISDNISKYSKYFTELPDGSMVLNTEGRKAYDRVAPSANEMTMYTGGTGAFTEKNAPGNEFKKFIDSLTEVRPGTGVIKFEAAAGTAFKNYLAEHEENRYDARATTEYDFTYNNEGQQKSIKQKVMTAAEGNDLVPVTYNTSTKSFEQDTSKGTLPMSTFADSRYVIVSSRMSFAGTQIMVLDTKTGDLTRYEQPSIHRNAEAARDAAMRSAEATREAIVSGRWDDDPEQLAEANRRYSEYLQSAYWYQAQLGTDYTTEDVKVTPRLF